MPLAAAAASAGTSHVQKKAAGNSGSNPLCFHQLDHTDPGLQSHVSDLFSYCSTKSTSAFFKAYRLFYKCFSEW